MRKGIYFDKGQGFGGGVQQKPSIPASTLQLSPEQQRLWNRRAHEAIHAGSLELLKQCILEGADRNAENIYGESLLWISCSKGVKCSEITKFLAGLDGVNLNHRSFEGLTPTNAVPWNYQEGYAILEAAAKSRGVALELLKG